MSKEVSSAANSWHVLYTRPRHEKKLQEFLSVRGVTVYLPMYKTIKQWSDRRKKVEEPLFKSYLFVKADESNYFTILNAPGAVKFVHFGDDVATISNKEVEMIEQILKHPDQVAVEEFRAVAGDKIKIASGPFKNIEGTLISIRGKNRLIIQIEQLGKNVIIDIPAYNVQNQNLPSLFIEVLLFIL
ncbi:MAG: UpxY family transcription antiterminator [Bacteroidia bacterium]